MQIPLTPSQAARDLNVSVPTIYKWVEAKKLEATVVRSGETTRIYICKTAVDLKRAELEAAAMRYEERPPKPKDERDWINQYKELIGTNPPLCPAYVKGLVTFEQMRSEVRRRFAIVG
jgi:excisionase family DNA binding protein